MALVRNLLVRSGEKDLRLDRWFKRHFPQISHGYLQKLMRTGQIRVNGARIKSSTRLKEGQVVRIPPINMDTKRKSQETGSNLSKDEISLVRSMVIYRDDDIIVVNKPPGLAVQGGSKIFSHLDGLLDGLKFSERERPKLVHRLDKDTSGLMLLARNSFAAANLTSAFRERAITKVYWALVVGVPEPREGQINAPISKQRNFGIEKMNLGEGDGPPSVSDFLTIETAGKRVAWLALRPQTGRTHQLRVHCKILGTPILGDGKYGGKEAFIDGLPFVRKLHLHARSLEFKHPSGEKMFFEAPLSPDMGKTWQFFGFDINCSTDVFTDMDVKEKA
ncbi:MAG: RluA family pseudouridine synthase [Pseudomonadota bacterium]|nr:RluA family pseudouridine synthase [Pseudomonadota bacterium]